MGGLVAEEAPPLLFRHWHDCGPARRGYAVPPRPRGSVSPGLPRTPEATQDDAKEEIHLRQGPDPGSSRQVVVVGVSSSRLSVLQTNSQSPRPDEMTAVTRRRRRRRVRRAQPKLLEEPAFVFSGFHTSINDEGGRHAAPS